jgi:hypothetical protein
MGLLCVSQVRHGPAFVEGIERETSLGSSGVNDGKGIGALAAWAKKLVGGFLSWKNRPIYEELCRFIDDDLLTLVQAHVPDLEQRRTAFSAPGGAPAEHSFASVNSKCEGRIAGYKGGKVDWLTTCSFYNEALGFGNTRIDGWSDRSTRAPHMGIHLSVVFNVR